MQLEAHELDPANRQKYTTRLRSYQTELGKLTADLVSNLGMRCTSKPTCRRVHLRGTRGLLHPPPPPQH